MVILAYHRYKVKASLCDVGTSPRIQEEMTYPLHGHLVFQYNVGQGKEESFLSGPKPDKILGYAKIHVGKGNFEFLEVKILRGRWCPLVLLGSRLVLYFVY